MHLGATQPSTGRPRPLAIALPLLVMVLAALRTPSPWGGLWVAVPALGAAGYLANRHPAHLGWIPPAAAVVWLLAGGHAHAVWAWLAVGAVASASLFGVAHASPVPAGRGLWALAPLLVLAAAFPLTATYAPTVEAAAESARRSGEQALVAWRQLGVEGGALAALAERVEAATTVLEWVAGHLLPGILFAWGALLVGLALWFARRAVRAVGRPEPGRAPFSAFRMPEAAIWVLVVALALLALRVPRGEVVGGNLAFCVGLGYCLQGLAVVDFVLLARGVPSGIVRVLFLFVILFALPALVLGATGIGLADVWLDLRRRNAAPGPQGGRS